MEQTVSIEKSPIDKGGHQRLLMMTSLRCQGKGLSSVEMGLSPFTILGVILAIPWQENNTQK